MKRLCLALVSGTLFGGGLAVSGMVDTHRVRGFLDAFGAWDPTLAFVMGGAIVPMAIAWLLQKHVEHPWADDCFDLPETKKLDAPLALGALLFGIGWGLSGLCPGPAIANLALAPLSVLPFVVTMVAGMVLHRLARG